jgi:hypothetical protein
VIPWRREKYFFGFLFLAASRDKKYKSLLLLGFAGKRSPTTYQLDLQKPRWFNFKTFESLHLCERYFLNFLSQEFYSFSEAKTLTGTSAGGD